MAFLRRLWRIFAGDRDQAEIAVTRTPDGVRLRMPHRGHDREFWTPWLVIALFLGPILIGTTIQAALNLPPEDHNILGTLICLLTIIISIAGIYWKWRVDWHYEILLTPTHLFVEYFTTRRCYPTKSIERSRIRQFTITTFSDGSLLHAESSDTLLRLLGDPHRDCLLRLANLINDERVHNSAAVPVKLESPGEISVERAEPPLNSKIVLTRTDSGVTLDFPMPEDQRPHLRRRAWRLFESGLVLLVGVVVGFAILSMFRWPDLLPFLAIPFFIGLVCLMIAASHASNAWTGTGGDNDLRQLGVADNLLIRTTRDHNKRIWFGHEIARIEVEREPTEDGPDWLALNLHTHSHVSTTLYGPFGDDSRTDYRRKAMLEWIATVLRHALNRSEHEAPPGPPPEVEESIAQAIQDRSARPAESHITH